jgi:hypothetical protein
MNDGLKLAVTAIPLTIITGVAWLLVLPNLFMDNLMDRAPVYLLLGLPTAVGFTALSILFLTRQFRIIRAGFPLADERYKMNRLKAGYYSFFVIGVLTLALFVYTLSLSTELYDLGSNYVDESFFGLLVAMPVSFVSFWTYFTLFGKDA